MSFSHACKEAATTRIFEAISVALLPSSHPTVHTFLSPQFLKQLVERQV